MDIDIEARRTAIAWVAEHTSDLATVDCSIYINSRGVVELHAYGHSDAEKMSVAQALADLTGATPDPARSSDCGDTVHPYWASLGGKRAVVTVLYKTPMPATHVKRQAVTA